jgi:uncharacterized membrane protein
MIGLVHSVFGVLALLLGGVIFLTPKGTRWHVRLGWAYVASMAGVNLTAFVIYHLTGGLTVFHLLAAISLFTVVGGVLPVRFRWRNWLWRHYQYVTWSYVGLLAATCNEAFVRVDFLRRLTENTTAWLPLIVLAVLLAVSGLVIFGKQRWMLARYGGRA